MCQVADPDRSERHEPGRCGGCGAGLADAAQVGVEQRQVFDVPPIAVAVTEHRLVKRRCGCGAVTTADAPAGVEAPVQYSPNAAAIVVYLYAGQFLSRDRTAKALNELFGTPVSAGTVAAMTARAAAALTARDGFAERVRARLIEAEVAHFDETALRVDRRLRWVHSASTGKYVLLTVHDRRGVVAMDAAGVLPRFTGVAVHDGWAPMTPTTRRPMPAATPTSCGSCKPSPTTTSAPAARGAGPSSAADALRTMKRLVDGALARDGTLADVDTARMARAGHAFRSAARLGVRATAARASNLEKDHNALARRLLAKHDDHLRFTVDARVPFDTTPPSAKSG